MAGIRATITSGEVAFAATTQTILQLIAPTNQRVFITEFEVSFQGVDSTQPPIKVQLVRQSTAGSGGSSVTPVKINSADDETVQSTALKTITAASETTDAIIDEKFVSPNGGGFTWGPGNIGVLVAKGGERIGIRFINSGSAVDGIATIKFEE